MHLSTRLSVILLLLFAASPSFAATPDEAASAVMGRYRLTKPGILGDFKEIGTVLTPRKEGLRASRPSKVLKPSVVKNGELAVAGGSDLPLGGDLTGLLKPGDRLYLFDVRTGDDHVLLDLHTVATHLVTGIRGPTRLQASVRFQYDGGLAGVTAQQLLDDIGQWLGAEGEHRPAYGETERPTATIRLGQSQEDVTAIFGPPEKQILLGAKTLFIYPYLKVIFVDGKVVDAE